ncbi:Eco57I restriction-modification methylase domain-containing protein [Bradyrhizobium sp. SZCCHNR3015]|uniref:Eco57I restriction-modification methylase domain-containing protein n=1 Tax=Bradyrhizobium sp. SZCCHNR3015 TaxID=3057395 RepID=UPI002915CB74|nr:type IIL restriction-modification enzyme MmeI [Bradyrhizobium sp. SZCCHNR3015]
MSDLGHHGEWLSLLDISGPFLAEPVLEQALPQGLQGLDPVVKKEVRQAYDEWREALDFDEAEFPKLHSAWIAFVMERVLGIGAEFLVSGDKLSDEYRYLVPENGITLVPDAAVTDGKGKSLLLVKRYDAEIPLSEAAASDGWAANPIERMIELCRATGIRLALVTNGEQWTLIDAPVGAVTSTASWYARLWSQEPLTLQAFAELLGIRRFFSGAEAELATLLDKSLTLQDEVTDALGEQVRRAVEVLVQSLDRADQDRNRELLKDVSPEELYEAGLTIMMRIVFLLSAEERGLLLLGDRQYEDNYAVSTLRGQLRLEADEIQERRWDAWSRLLSLFRAVFAGVDHGSMRMPALGGSLFDPDRFPFLEGRSKGSNWKADAAVPLPIDNRTVLLLLDAVQLFQGRTLSYLALDVEQIGYVYEGLLERTVVRASEVTLDLTATKNAKTPWVTLFELDDAAASAAGAVEALLKERTGSSASRIRNDLAKEPDETESGKLLAACDGDLGLRDRIKPYFHLLRTDSWGYPLVYPKGTFVVASGSDRRETGTHYTPKSFTEAIVRTTLEPLVYVGPSEGAPRDEWRLKSPDKLLDLKVCDPAMGSGAFLVQVCRYLADRVVEAWAEVEKVGKAISADGEVNDEIGALEPLSPSVDERSLTAKRLIAERCLYGVDMNPLAVELAKLSIWLVTLAKGRPFGFLDHNLRVGDSLFGVFRREQLEYLTLDITSATTKQLFAHQLDGAIDAAIQIRLHLRSQPIRDITDILVMEGLNKESQELLRSSSVIADALLCEYLETRGRPNLASLAISADGYLTHQDSDHANGLLKRIRAAFAKMIPNQSRKFRPFHWLLEFPEVFARDNPGFDAMVGNPPFMGNKFWKEKLGEGFQTHAELVLGTRPGKVDLCVLFHRRAADCVRVRGAYGLIATDNIAEGSALTVGLSAIVKAGDIFSSRKGMAWPGTAAVSVSIICFFKGPFRSQKLCNGEACALIGPRLTPIAEGVAEPARLEAALFAFEGVHNGKGLAFLIDKANDWFVELADENGSRLVPYISGEDITTMALQSTQRWALDLEDRSLEEIEAEFPKAFSFLMQVVKPTRTATLLKSYKGLLDRWWQFWNTRADLMRRIRKTKHCVVFSKNTTFPFCMLAPTKWIYTNKVVLIGIERGDELAICLSSFFRLWLEAYSGGRLRGWLTISINESIAKFPLPVDRVSKTAVDAAEKFNELLVDWAKRNDVGVTAAISALHSQDCVDEHISRLRELLSTIDNAVAEAFEWTDIDLAKSFFPSDDPTTSVPTKYDISRSAKAVCLDRLLALNLSQERAA